MEKLPTEIEENILDRLTIQATLQAKQVCKRWKTFLRSKIDKVGLLFTFTYWDRNKNQLCYGDHYDPALGKMNYSYSYDRIKNIHIRKFVQNISYLNNNLGSCNGLVCFGPGRGRCFEKNFLICNPFTGEVVSVLKHDSVWQNWSYSGICGFGYCQSMNEYKIVSMLEESQDPSNFQVLVYTVGGGGWRSKGSIHTSLFDSPIKRTAFDSAAAGTYANGALHWLRQHNTIVAFDLEDEKFQVISTPRFKYVRYKRSLKLLGGNNLYLVSTSTSREEPNCMDIWAYKRKNTNATNGCTGVKQKYNDERSWNWIKLFSVNLQEPRCMDIWAYKGKNTDVKEKYKDNWTKHLEYLRLLEPLAITRKDDFLFYYRNWTTLYCYDLKTSTKNKLFNGWGWDCNMINVIPHANSTVSIMSKDLLELQVYG